MKFLLVNPWIYDFSAFDLWLKPLGLLYIQSVLKNLGNETVLIDCLDRKHPFIKKEARSNIYGCGHFISEKVKKPEIFKDIPKNYRRYGMPEKIFNEIISQLKKPDLILVTSGMTYWYEGVFECIKILRKVYKDVPVILGGIYASLCKEHARRYSGADIVVEGCNMRKFFKIIFDVTGEIFDEDKIPDNFSEFPIPCYDDYIDLEYIALRSSSGCIFNCTYCAVRYLNRKFCQKAPEKIVNEIIYFRKNRNIKNFAFYDDALLVNSDLHIKKILEKIIKTGLDFFFHTPNGLHARYIDKELAELIRKANFISPRISFETSSEKLQKETGSKVDNKMLENALKNLCESGYSTEEIIVYAMIGLPDQKVEDIKETVKYLKDLKVRISLSEYSPIPHTDLWSYSKIGDQDEPLLSNNSIYYLLNPETKDKILEIKHDVFEYNSSL